METGIISWGAYLPRLRLERKAAAEANSWVNGALASRSSGTRSFCNWDEDSLTMGVEATRACFERSAERPSRLVFATTTAPFADRPSSGLAALALQLPVSVKGLDHGGSQRAASNAS